MIGVFDSGIGGLTVLRALAARFPAHEFRYVGDHAHMPYGDRSADDIVQLTRAGVEHLFGLGCRLVVLGCNTATAVAARRLQTEWLPASPWCARGYNVLGIVAPTVEAATQTPWAVTTPQYPQKYNTDVVAVFGTTRTIASGVFVEEIRKRCPKVRVVQRACPGLADAIEQRRPEAELDRIVALATASALEEIGGPPHRVILGCTHYPLVAQLFQRHLPAFSHVLDQPQVVADSLEDYLARHAHFAAARFTGSYAAGPVGPGLGAHACRIEVFTTGDPVIANAVAGIFWPDAPAFMRA